MQDGRKAVWSIPNVSVTFFPSLKQNFIAYRSSKVWDCIFEIHQLWQSGFSSEGARGVIVIVVGNEHDDTSSNPGRDRLHFT